MEQWCQINDKRRTERRSCPSSDPVLSAAGSIQAKQCSFHSQAQSGKATGAQQDGPVRSWLLTDSFVLDCVRIGLQDESQINLRRELQLKDIKPRWKLSTFQDSHRRHDAGIDIDFTRDKLCVHELQRELFRACIPACFSDTTRARSEGVCKHLRGDSHNLRHSRAGCSKCSLQNLWTLRKSGPKCTGTAMPSWFQPHYCLELSLQRCWTHVILTESSALGRPYLTLWGVSSHALSRSTKLSSSQSLLVRKGRN